MTTTLTPPGPTSTATNAPRCPRHAKRATYPSLEANAKPLDLRALAQEPFRLFFPVATLAGLIGVLLWPLMIAGWMTTYPGEIHARLMVQGFFGGFILGFLGTSVPRFLEVAPLRRCEAFPLLVGLVVCTVAHLSGQALAGDAIFAVQLVALMLVLRGRCRSKRDNPPPGFALMPLAFVSGIVGFALLHLSRHSEQTGLPLLGRLLGYHAFVLLCILGAGGFLLPRFLGVGPRRKLAASANPERDWKRARNFAFLIGLTVISTYALEAANWPRLAGTVRALAVAGYFLREIPIERLRWTWNGVQWLLVAGLACLPVGILTSTWLGPWRIAMAHVELVGGFGLITAGVAARVVLGHTGQRAQLERFNGWLTAAAGLMLLGMLTRVFADLVPSSMISHYLYGALCWAAGLAIWAVCVLRHVWKRDPEQ
jgi:uncharacterized protein involved in response to NO